MTTVSTATPISLAFSYQADRLGSSLLVQADCFEWLAQLPPNSLHAVVTDPPYGVKEFEAGELTKREAGNGGIWRLPPAFDGHVRAPLPRFTALTPRERDELQRYFTEWSRLVLAALRPGGHVFVASNTFLSQLVFASIVQGGLEFRGEIIRLVRTMRGGDKPKNAEEEFAGVCSLPRGSYEPWGLFRKPMLPGMKVSDCLREYETGGLRRISAEQPFSDVINSERTPKKEREIAAHPSLKPQSLMRQLVQAALPLGRGIIADPFMGGGSTVAAAEACGLSCVGIERSAEFYGIARQAIPKLARLAVATAPAASVQASLFG